MRLFAFTTLLASAIARPSFIAVPADQIAFYDLSSLHVRVPRQTLTPPSPQAVYQQDYQPIPVQEYESNERQESQPNESQEYQPNERLEYQPNEIQEYQPNERQQYQLNDRQDYQPIPVLPYQGQPYHGQLVQHLSPPPAPIQRAPLQLAPAPLQLAPAPHIVEAAESPNLQAAAELAERPPDFGEYVDFGAHTGDNGAFGWYADYPINNHENSFSK